MDFNKLFKIISISLFGFAALGIIIYLGYASSKDCLGCTLPQCEGITETGEVYLRAADDCAQPYEVIKEREQFIRQSNASMGMGDDSRISECSQECLNYAGNFMSFAISLVVIAACLTLLFAVYTIVINRNKIKGVIIAVAGLGIVLLFSYIMASDAVPTIIGYNDVITTTEAKWVETTLYMLYILLTVAVLGIIGSGVYKIVQQNQK